MCSCVRGEGPGQTALCDCSKILRGRPCSSLRGRPPVSKLCAHAVLGLISAHLRVTQTRTTEGTTAAATERRRTKQELGSHEGLWIKIGVLKL